MRRVHLVVRAGVGFRPFVAGLARRLGLGGMVRNDSGSVVIEDEGPRDAIHAFVNVAAATSMATGAWK